METHCSSLSDGCSWSDGWIYHSRMAGCPWLGDRLWPAAPGWLAQQLAIGKAAEACHVCPHVNWCTRWQGAAVASALSPCIRSSTPFACSTLSSFRKLIY